MTNITITRNRRADLTKTAAYYTAFISIGLASAVLGPTLPDLARNTGTAIGDIGFLFTARSLGFLIGSTIGARLYDRLPGHRLMGSMIIAMALMIALVPVMSQLWVLTAVLLLMGFVENLVDVGGNTLIVWIHRHNVGPFMNGLHFFFGIGAFISPILVAQALLRTDSIQWAYWLLALLVLPAALLILPQSSPTSIIDNTEEKAASRLNYRLIGMIGLFYFLYVGLEVGFSGWVFTYATTLNITGAAAAAYLTSAFWGALTVGRLLAIPIATYLRPRAILFSDLLLGMVSMGILLLWPQHVVALWMGTIGLGLSLASVFPTMLSFAERRMTITGQITGYFFVGASLGGMTLPWLMGKLLDNIAPIAIVWFVLISLVVEIGLLGIIRLQTR